MPAVLTWLTLILIVQKSCSRPLESSSDKLTEEPADHLPTALSDNEFDDFVYGGFGPTRGTSTTTSKDGSNDLNHIPQTTSPTTSQGLPEIINHSQTIPRTIIQSQLSSSSLEPQDSSETKGAFSNVLGWLGVGNASPTDAGESSKSEKPNGSATIISSYTYPVGFKPAKPPKPTTGQGKPPGSSSHDKPEAPKPVSSPPSLNKPPDSSLMSSLFESPVTTGNQKPNIPITLFGSQPGTPFFGNPSMATPPSGASMFPGFMPGLAHPPQVGYMSGFMRPPPSPMLSSDFEGIASPFGGLGSSFGSLPGHADEDDFALPNWIFPLMKSMESSSSGLPPNY